MASIIALVHTWHEGAVAGLTTCTLKSGLLTSAAHLQNITWEFYDLAEELRSTGSS